MNVTVNESLKEHIQ